MFKCEIWCKCIGTQMNLFFIVGGSKAVIKIGQVPTFKKTFEFNWIEYLLAITKQDTYIIERL